MRIGKLFLVISYALVLLSSGSHLTGVSLNEGAITYFKDSLWSFWEKDEENSVVGDGFCHVVYALNGGNNHEAELSVYIVKHCLFLRSC